MTKIYSPDRYDQNFSLKVPIHLALVMLYIARHLFIVFLAFNPLPKLSGAFSFLQPLVSSPALLLTDVPGFLVLFAWARREPGASLVWHRVWAHGRSLLTVALLSHFLLLAVFEGAEALKAFNYRPGARLVIVNLVLDLLLVYYLWRFSIVRDVFADFPEDAKGAGK